MIQRTRHNGGKKYTTAVPAVRSTSVPLTALIVAALLLLAYQVARAEGEAGPITLRGQGHFFVGIETSEPQANGAVQVYGQTYVGYQLAGEQRHRYPIVLVHGGGGSPHWFSTPDGRDGWRDYFVAAGFDVYWMDRPGYGRSPTNVAYGQMDDSPNSTIPAMLAQSEQWPGDPQNHKDPSILATLASSEPGPFGGEFLAGKNLSQLLGRIGPAILMTYSAGSESGWWAADMNPDNVAAIYTIEPTRSNVLIKPLTRLTFDPPLGRNFEPTEDDEECLLQPGSNPSKLTHLSKIPVVFVGGESGWTNPIHCNIKSMRQAGVNAEYLSLPEIGIRGNGHYMMIEKNNGAIAKALIERMSKIK